METVMGMVVREGDGHEVYPHRGESLGAGGTVELGVWVVENLGDGGEGGVPVDREATRTAWESPPPLA